MSNLIYLTDHELAVVLANLKASPLPTQAGPVWRKIVHQVGHGELVGGEYDPNAKAVEKGDVIQDITFTCPECGLDFTQPCWVHLREHYGDYDPNAQAESRQGEPRREP